MTGMKEPAEHHHFWVQAPVPPLDVDGLAVVTVGTVIFALTSVVLAIGYDWLAAHGHGSWLQISVAGFGIFVTGGTGGMGRDLSLIQIRIFWIPRSGPTITDSSANSNFE